MGARLPPGRGREGCPRSRSGRRGRVATAPPGTVQRGDRRGAPGALPAAAPASRPALTMLRRGVRAVPAALCGGARRGAAAAAIPAAELSYRWEGLGAATPPYLGTLACGEGVPPSGAAGARRGPPSCGGTPRCGARSCSPSSAGREAGVWGPALGVTGSAEPPASGAEQIEQPNLLCYQLPQGCGETPSPPGPLEQEKGGETRQRHESESGAHFAP